MGRKYYHNRKNYPPPPVDTVDKVEKTVKTPRKKEKHTYSEEFEEFWFAYPRKEDKGMAYKQWNARLKDGYSPDVMLTAAKHYASVLKKRGTETEYIKLPKTFISSSLTFIEFAEKPKDLAKGVQYRLFDTSKYDRPDNCQ